MILDKLENAQHYYVLGERFETALRFLAENRNRMLAMDSGVHEIDGRDVYLFLRRYNTFPLAQCKTEAHGRYADIQMLLQGKERFGYIPLAEAGPVREVYPERDVAYYTAAPEFFTLSDGRFVIALPQDAHCPDCAVDDIPEPVVKAVMKVRIG